MNMQSLNYIGSKKTLIDFIKSSILESVKDHKSLNFCDLFAGTGVVGFNMSEYFKCVISNDMEYYSFCINNALLGCAYSRDLQERIDNLNELADDEKQYGRGFVVKEYTDPRLFFTVDNARRIDVIRTEISKLYDSKVITKSEYYFLIASLLVSCDKIANTTSVYGAFLKKIKASAEKKLIVVPIHTRTYSIESNVYNCDVTELDYTDEFDVVYLDPPYNQRQYGANYCPLNYIAMYDDNIKVTKKTGLIEGYNKSVYSKKTDIKASYKKLMEFLKGKNVKYVFISYNNEGLVSSKDMEDILKEFGRVELKKIEYKKYKSSKDDNKFKVEELLWCVYM
jgi:adenine-specific DNA-methyltransferase